MALTASIQPATPTNSRLRRNLAAAAVAIAATVLMTWPLARHAGDHLLDAIYYWDAYANSMIMGSRVDAALGRSSLSLYDSYYFAPLSPSIVFNENHFGLSLLFAPFYLASGNPLLAYNLTLLLSLGLSVFFTYLLVRRLTGSDYAGLVAGVAFAFSPYVMFEIGRIQLVATQWIPATFLMLHMAVEQRRKRDVAGFWLCYLLQIGTCLYYAMFLLPLLGLAGVVLLARHRPPRSLYVMLGLGGALAGVVALAMVYPYFAARDVFELERTLAFASSYDGKLSFFANVHETNRTLTSMHHQGELRGAHEEIAFPGFTVLAMVLLSLGAPLWEIRGRGIKSLSGLALRWLTIASLALFATLLTRSMLSGAVVLGLGVWHQARRKDPFPFSGGRGLYLGLLLLAIAMFLGLSPLEYDGSPVRGLYYYFHSYFPGFNGIRKVSRQAVMTSFLFASLASFGSAWLLSRLPGALSRGLATMALLALTCFELRTFPHPLKEVWAGRTVPPAYQFLASLPKDDLIATVPQGDGKKLFRGDAGMAFCDYLALYHKHRFVNGQSSWMPPVTALVRRSLSQLPSEGAWRTLAAVGTRHIVVHGADLPDHRRQLPEQLAAKPERFRRVFQDDSDSVFSLTGLDDPTLALLEVPPLPPRARLIPQKHLRARANLRQAQAGRSIDGDVDTYWTGRRFQERGHYYELSLDRPATIVALELESPDHVMDMPLSFELAVSEGGSAWNAVAEQPMLRLYREQIHTPKTFVFRLVLLQPARADRIRITIRQPLPGHYLTIHEARLYEQSPK